MKNTVFRSTSNYNTSYATHTKVAEVKSNGQKGVAIKNLNTSQHKNVNMPTKIKCCCHRVMENVSLFKWKRYTD